MIPFEARIDLAVAPADRWPLTPAQQDSARAMIKMYYADMGGSADMMQLVHDAARPMLAPDHWAELEAIAERLSVSPQMVLLCNAYYDMIKALTGGTAFAVDTDDGPLHARSLDWHTENRLLNDATMVQRFVCGEAGDFVGIGWPGYTGVLSGVAPGRFAITLNAVLSDELPQIAMPVALVIRQVFEQAASFDKAVAWLADVPLACDCLLLVTGTQTSEMMVIERTPSRSALRGPVDGSIYVANDYRVLAADGVSDGSALQATSCGRFDRIGALLYDPPDHPAACFEYLSDARVRMTSTVQQMVFSARTGRYDLIIP